MISLYNRADVDVSFRKNQIFICFRTNDLLRRTPPNIQQPLPHKQTHPEAQSGDVIHTALRHICPRRVRLVGGASRCAGELEMNHQREWRPVTVGVGWNQISVDKVCTHLDCGSAVSTKVTDNSPYRRVWWIDNDCVQSESALRECVKLTDLYKTKKGHEVICSGLLVQPNVSVSPIVGVSGAEQQGYHVLLGSSFTVTCSTEPQYQGGSFHLLFTTSDTAHNYTLPAVNHSAHFLFPAARSAHRGDYTCVYHAYVFSYNFSSESRPLHVIVSASVTDLIIRCVVVLLLLTVSTLILYFHFKVDWRLRPFVPLQLPLPVYSRERSSHDVTSAQLPVGDRKHLHIHLKSKLVPMLTGQRSTVTSGRLTPADDAAESFLMFRLDGTVYTQMM
ncbi:hypothetical protein F2P81_017716 [Scophthalmus maximus]|uniref:SRCR domain-containing protein n=1 Tax=Scophthalmus maximus TaxID=52904 RepID=A0A6A4SEN2_SCOMX|nr:hypothetical protein F2P81_017716 [Scophthalmus maximus]